jgi:hypothetical protein
MRVMGAGIAAELWPEVVKQCLHRNVRVPFPAVA